ncbi:hypothetical protein PybrP1_011667 [[Pythium] brassicae (nom. inval.)]|nr:hypothetical protein PybrP1_011667 [[Pythium] brassicae (nom. inval.)]
MASNDKLRVLCLHGYRQNGETLRSRIAAFRRAFKSSVEFVCVDAPIVLQNDHSAKNDSSSGKVTLSHVDESIEYIAKICREQGPFDGIFGFSQGGTIASLTVQRQHVKPEDWPAPFRFAIFVSAPHSQDPNYGDRELKLEMPSLHMIGETDTVVNPKSSQILAAGFVAPTTFGHAGGHHIPANKEAKDAFRDFFKQLQ